MKLFVVSCLSAVLLLAVACGGSSDSAGATSTPASATVAPSSTSPEGPPTNTPTLAPTKAASTPTATSVPPTDTPVPPTDTPVPPTDTPVPPTETPVPPTDTPPPPPPTATSPPPPPSGSSSVSVTTQSLQFVPAALYASSGTITISLTNMDNLVPHNISVGSLGTSATCAGPCTVSLTLQASPGSYPFHCTIHPYMTGTLVVQ